MKRNWYTALVALGLAVLTACSGGSEGAPEETPSTAAVAADGTTTRWIYRDGLAAGWNDWSWASRNLRNRRPVAAGRYSISASFGAWQGLYFVNDGLAVDELESLTLRVHGGKNGGGARLQVRAMVDGVLTGGADLGAHCAAGKVVAGRWTTCTVPLAKFAPSGIRLTGIQIQEFRGGSIPTIYFDEVGLRLRTVSPTPPPAPTIAVAVSPTSAALLTGQQQQFQAVVANTSDTRVTWSVAPVGGGTVDASGLYTAPATAGTFSVIATSVADPTQRATASVQVAPRPVETVAVSISPLATTLEQGASRRFTAAVTGTSNTSVTWSVRESGGGTIDGTGLYTAPGAAGTFHVTATSAADPTASASATVTVQAPAPVVTVAVNPASASLAANGTQQFSATVSGASDTSVTWAVQEGSSGGSVDSTGRYTAPATAGTYHVVATSRADAAAKATATVTVSAVTQPPPVSGPIDMSMLPADRRDTWNPGIPGGIPQDRQVFTTLSGLATNGTGDASGAINQAINNAHQAYLSSGRIQEVVLPAGTFRVASTITLNRSGVVLRGQGPSKTKLRYDGGGDALRIGRSQWTDYGSSHGPWALARDAKKGSKQIVLSNGNATRIEEGDILVIDEEDDTSFVRIGDARYEKRQPSMSSHGPALRGSGLWRSVTSMIQVTGKSVGSTETTLTLADPLHMNFRTGRYAQVYQMATEYTAARPAYDGVHYAGVEDLYLTGGPIGTNNVAFCWIEGLEVDGNPGTPNVGSYNNQGGISGRSVNLFHAYRCEVRNNYIHHSRNISQGGGAYLLSVSSYTSETLIEDNIIVWGNKLLVGNMMGGGNVIAYNYVDNARTNHSSWQEGAIDLNHQSFTHTALVEGNWATNITSDTTHGNAGWHVFHRNFATGQNSAPLYGAYPYQSAPDGQYRRAGGTDGWHREATYIGNVMHAGSGSGTYQVDGSTGSQISTATVWRVGYGVDGGGDSKDDGTALRLLYRHGNWDNVTQGIVWDAANANRTIPASLYLTSKPAFFGSYAWPWVNPQGGTAAQRVGVLPAKARFDAMN